MSRRCLATLICAAGALLLAPAGAAGEGFTAPVDLSAPRAASTWTCGHDAECYLAGVADVDVATNASGDAIATWIRLHDEVDTYMVHAAYRPAGGTFGPAQTLGRYFWNPYDTGGPEAGIDDAGRAVVAWRDQLEPGSPFSVGRLTEAPPSGTFGEPTTLDDAGRVGTDPVVAMAPSGHAAVAWVSSGSGFPRPTARVATREPGGTFGPAVSLGSQFSTGHLDVEVAEGGAMVVAWRDAGDDSTYRLLASVRPPAGTFSAARVLSTGYFRSHDVAVTRDGRAAVVWSPAQQYGAHLPARASFLTPAGALAGPEEELPEEAHSWNPEVTFDGDVAVVAWGDCTEAAGRGDCSSMTADRPPGASFGPAKAIAGETGAGGALELVSGPGGHLAGLTISADGAVIALTRRAPGEGFAPFAPVPHAAGEAVAPGVALDGSGSPIVAFVLRTADDLERAQAVVWDATPPSLTHDVPERATPGEAVAMRATAADPAGATIAWSFGDGATATGTDVSHAYAAAGQYAVTITATDGVGNAVTVRRRIDVAGPTRKPDGPDPVTSVPGEHGTGPGPGTGTGTGTGTGHPSPPAEPKGVGARVRARFTPMGRFTEVTRLGVTDMPAGAAVRIRCRGKGCPFSVKRWARTPSGWRNALRAFERRTRLRAGTVIELRITAPGRTTQVVRYTLRHNRQPTLRRSAS